MSEVKIIDGNNAAAECMRLIEPDVVAAYPITPTTYVMEGFSKFVADGKVDTELVLAESEHAAMSACVGAAAGGGRAITATASQGLILMHEVLFNASGMRLPIVLFTGNRTVGAPLSIHGDHSDVMAVRDSGFIMLFADSAQEVFDLGIQAIRIAEDEKVRTPVMINFDGFDVSHMIQNVDIESKEDVQKFIGKAKQVYPLFDLGNPVTFGAADKPDYFMEHKRSQEEGIVNAFEVSQKVGEEFSKKFSRGDYGKSVEYFGDPDAQNIIVTLGSSARTTRKSLKKNQAILKIRLFRPFPAKDIIYHLKNKKNIAVLDRVAPCGARGGPLYNEIKSALFDETGDVNIFNFIYGLGGRDFFPDNAEDIFSFISKGKGKGQIKWVSLRE